MKVKYEIEKKIEDDNGKKIETETTVTFDDVLDIKKKAKGIGTFLAKKAKKTAEIAGNITANIAYIAASVTADALDSIADKADTAVNAIDRFIDNNFEFVEEPCDCGECCGECCCGDTCENDVEEETDEDESSEEDATSEKAENLVKNFFDGMFEDLTKILEVDSDDVKKALEESARETIDFIHSVVGDIAKTLGIKVEKSEKISEDEGTADEDENENVSDDSSETAESDEVSDSKNDFADKIAEIPEGTQFILREYLDYLEVYSCNEKVPDIVKELDAFLAAIKYPGTIYSRKAFEIAVTLKKITYYNVLNSIKEYFPNDSEDQIFKHLVDEFNEWDAKENIRKYCPHANLRYLLIYFVSKVRGC